MLNFGCLLLGSDDVLLDFLLGEIAVMTNGILVLLVLLQSSW